MSLLAGCSPDADAPADASGIGVAAAGPGPAGGGPQNSGGGNTAFLAKVADAPDRVAHRGTRKLELYYGGPAGVIYREDIGTDGKGYFSIELIELLTPHPNPQFFQILQDGRQVMTYRFRDWLIRDYDLFLANYTHSVLNWSTVVAGRSCVQLDVMSTAPGTQIRYVVDVDPTNGMVMRWEEQDLAGQVLARMEYETYEPRGDVSDMTLVRRNFPTSGHDLDEDLDAIFGFQPLIPSLLPNSAFQVLPDIEKSTVPNFQGGPDAVWAKVYVTDGLEFAVVMSQARDPNPDNGEGLLGVVDHMQLGSWGALRGDMHGFPFVVAGKFGLDNLTLMLQSAVDGR
ncbi:MAG: hypothetical protein V3T22_06605 [Planctomycetota bacterium]